MLYEAFAKYNEKPMGLEIHQGGIKIWLLPRVTKCNGFFGRRVNISTWIIKLVDLILISNVGSSRHALDR